MRDLDSAVIAALAARTAVSRDFVWITVKDRSTGVAVSKGLWTGSVNVTTNVIDALTGATVSRLFQGGGILVSVSKVPLVADITVRTVDVVLSQLAAGGEQIVRTYDARLAPIQIYRGYFSTDTRAIIAPPRARFVGVVDEISAATPAEGGEGGFTLTCVSTTRELTKTSTAVRSHEDQIARYPGDNFRQDCNVVGQWDLAWGRASGTVT